MTGLERSALWGNNCVILGLSIFHNESIFSNFFFQKENNPRERIDTGETRAAWRENSNPLFKSPGFATNNIREDFEALNDTKFFIRKR